MINLIRLVGHAVSGPAGVGVSSAAHGRTCAQRINKTVQVRARNGRPATALTPYNAASRGGKDARRPPATCERDDIVCLVFSSELISEITSGSIAETRGFSPRKARVRFSGKQTTRYAVNQWRI